MRITVLPLLVIFLSLSGCVGTFSDQESTKEKSATSQETKVQNDEPSRPEEKTIINGWVVNTHVEYLHTIVGLRTKDNQLLNLVFLGVHMQLAPGMHCRLTYHRVNDISYLPELLRSQKADYFYLDKVELLDNNTGAK